MYDVPHESTPIVIKTSSLLYEYFSDLHDCNITENTRKNVAQRKLSRVKSIGANVMFFSNWLALHIIFCTLSIFHTFPVIWAQVAAKCFVAKSKMEALKLKNIYIFSALTLELELLNLSFCWTIPLDICISRTCLTYTMNYSHQITNSYM